MSSGVNDNKKADFAFLAERGFHYFLMAFVIALIAFSAGFVFMSVQEPEARPPEMIENEKGSVNVKPLPDYIVDKVPRDELESLKP